MLHKIQLGRPKFMTKCEFDTGEDQPIDHSTCIMYLGVFRSKPIVLNRKVHLGKG